MWFYERANELYLLCMISRAPSIFVAISTNFTEGYCKNTTCYIEVTYWIQQKNLSTQSKRFWMKICCKSTWKWYSKIQNDTYINVRACICIFLTKLLVGKLYSSQVQFCTVSISNTFFPNVVVFEMVPSHLLPTRTDLQHPSYHHLEILWQSPEAEQYISFKHFFSICSLLFTFIIHCTVVIYKSIIFRGLREFFSAKRILSNTKSEVKIFNHEVQNHVLPIIYWWNCV
jgi:hypothetical protein